MPLIEGSPTSLQAFPLHQPNIYPPGAPHDVRNIATADKAELESIDYSYPRFFLCLPLRLLAEKVKQRLQIVDDLECYIFQPSDDVDDYAAQLQQKDLEAHHVLFRSPVPRPTTAGNSTLYLAFSALLVPGVFREAVMDFWVNLGTGISTRHAQYCLDHFDELCSTSPVPRFNTRADRVPSHNPYWAGWIHRGVWNLAYLKDWISRLATPQGRDLKVVKAKDVFIFPNGMNAIYNASEAIALSNPNGSVVTFGWICPGTISHLRRGRWKEVIPLPMGSEEDLDWLTQVLAVNEKQICAIFCELPSNIKLTSPNLERIRHLAREHDLVVVCDETVGNFVNVDVSSYVDIITTSLTKMFSGAANVTGGSVIVNPNSRHYEKLHEAIQSRHETVLCFPRDISVLSDNCVNMFERVQKANKNTLDVLPVFTSHHAVARVNHPSLFRDLEYMKYERHRRRIGGYGNVFSVVFRHRGSAEHFYDHLDVCKGSSFGTNFTIAIPFVQLAAYNEQEKLEQYDLPKHTIRISVGLEEVSHIRAKMVEALKKVEEFEVSPGSEYPIMMDEDEDGDEDEATQE